MRIETIEVEVPEDPDAPIPADDPLRTSKEQVQERRREVRSRQQQARLEGWDVPLDQNLLQLQIQALIKYVCSTPEDRLVFEECFQSAILDLYDKADEVRRRAILLDGTNQQMVQRLVHGG